MNEESNNQEINQALKEFESESNKGQTISPPDHPFQNIITPSKKSAPVGDHAVERVSFDTDTRMDTYKPVEAYDETSTPKIVKMIMNQNGGNKRQAEWIIFGLVVVMIGISLYLFSVGGKTKQKSILTPADSYLHPNLILK